jgi:methyl-accepting chemotaxis protein
VVDTIGNIRQATEDTAKASENVAKEAQETAAGAERIQDLLAQFRVGAAGDLIPALVQGPAISQGRGIRKK